MTCFANCVHEDRADLHEDHGEFPSSALFVGRIRTCLRMVVAARLPIIMASEYLLRRFFLDGTLAEACAVFVELRPSLRAVFDSRAPFFPWKKWTVDPDLVEEDVRAWLDDGRNTSAALYTGEFSWFVHQWGLIFPDDWLAQQSIESKAKKCLFLFLIITQQ